MIVVLGVLVVAFDGPEPESGSPEPDLASTERSVARQFEQFVRENSFYSVTVDQVVCDSLTSFGEPIIECVLDASGGPERIENLTVGIEPDPNEPDKEVIDYDYNGELPDWALGY